MHLSRTTLIAVLALGAALLPAQHAAAVPYAPGDVFVGVGGGMVYHYTPAGVLVQTLDTTSGSSEQTGMAFDAAGNLYTTNFTAGNMSKFNNNGGLLVHPFAAGFHNSPESVVFDANGDLYVGEVNGANHIHKFTSAGAPLATYTPVVGPRGSDWMDLSADNCTMLCTSEGTLVRRFNVCTNTQGADFATLPAGSTAFALRIRAGGDVLVAAGQAVYRLDAGGALIHTYPKGDYGETSILFALNLDPDGTSFWTAGYSSRKVYRINIADGALISSFTAAAVGPTVAGLAIFAEPVVNVEPATWGQIKARFNE